MNDNDDNNAGGNDAGLQQGHFRGGGANNEDNNDDDDGPPPILPNRGFRANNEDNQRERLRPARQDPFNERNAFDFANVRPLVSSKMLPKAQALISRVLRDNDSVVTLQDMEKDDFNGMFKVMVCQFLRFKRSSKQTQAHTTRRRNGSGNVNVVNYDRLAYVMDVNGRAGHNVAVVLLGGGSNDLFWKFDVSMRDGLQTNSKTLFCFHVLLSCACLLFACR